MLIDFVLSYCILSNSEQNVILDIVTSFDDFDTVRFLKNKYEKELLFNFFCVDYFCSMY